MAAKKTAGAAAIAACALAAAAWAQQPIIYPAKGQSQQQQNADMGQCRSWATQNTGIDPAQVAQRASNQPPPPEPQGERVKGALIGGVVGGAIGGSDGAAGGAVVGIMAGGARQRQKQRDASQQQQQNQQYAQSQLATYNRAVAACMEARGYTIR
jgi:hypothetical protein